MQNNEMDEEDLGHTVDAWLTALRNNGLSDRRVGQLARLLGEAMSEGGPRSPEQERVLRRFDAWRNGPKVKGRRTDKRGLDI